MDSKTQQKRTRIPSREAVLGQVNNLDAPPPVKWGAGAAGAAAAAAPPAIAAPKAPVPAPVPPLGTLAGAIHAPPPARAEPAEVAMEEPLEAEGGAEAEYSDEERDEVVEAAALADKEYSAWLAKAFPDGAPEPPELDSEHSSDDFKAMMQSLMRPVKKGVASAPHGARKAWPVSPYGVARKILELGYHPTYLRHLAALTGLTTKHGGEGKSPVLPFVMEMTVPPPQGAHTVLSKAKRTKA